MVDRGEPRESREPRGRGGARAREVESPQLGQPVRARARMGNDWDLEDEPRRPLLEEMRSHDRLETVLASTAKRGHSYDEEDIRWRVKEQVRDWLLVLAFMLISFMWMLLVFLFQPGFR